MSAARASGPMHLHPSVFQPHNYVTLCGIAGDDETMTAPIVNATNDPLQITCDDCLDLLTDKANGT